jgi:hypothetical protein
MSATQNPPKLLDQLRHALRWMHYSYRTEQSYVKWVKRFVVFQKERFGEYRHPRDLNVSDIEVFLTHLAVDRHVMNACPFAVPPLDNG